VLVVDDDDETRELLSTLLAHAGADVSGAASAEEALRRLDDAVPDVLVSDIAMPTMTGLDLIERVRRRSGPRLPAVALSACGRAEDRESALRAGFDLHLVKPADVRALVSAVARVAALREPASQGRGTSPDHA
jgi:CheY-like chemotaxis protein